jgi:hypothetical protein
MPRRKDVTVEPGTGTVRDARVLKALTDQIGLTVRMREELRSKLAQSADRRRVSLNQEVIDRLEATFADEARFGGPELLAIANLVTGAFLRGASLGARARQHPEWGVGEMMADPFCYRAGAYAVADALGVPTPTSAPMSDPAALHELLTSMVARGAPMTVTEGEEEE